MEKVKCRAMKESCQKKSRQKSKIVPENSCHAGTLKSCRSHRRFGRPADLDPSPVQIPLADMDPTSQIWTPLPNFPFKHPLYHIW